jgi:hypothetical protein
LKVFNNKHLYLRDSIKLTKKWFWKGILIG